MPTKGQRNSARQEAKGARDFGGQVQPGSGNGPTRKGDVRTSRFDPGLPALIEFKTTGASQYSLKLRDLETIGKNALIDGRTMMFGLEFTGPRLGSKKYVTMEHDDVVELFTAVTEIHELRAEVRSLKAAIQHAEERVAEASGKEENGSSDSPSSST